jgi:hypothetical protein
MSRFSLFRIAIIAGLWPAVPAITNAQTPDVLQDYIYGYAPVAMEATQALQTASAR